MEIERPACQSFTAQLDWDHDLASFRLVAFPVPALVLLISQTLEGVMRRSGYSGIPAGFVLYAGVPKLVRKLTADGFCLRQRTARLIDKRAFRWQGSPGCKQIKH